ncbi:MAG: XkdF-like putative serine protease domain-containing protein [bacterium]|nr:XkdF-like putative serine protease domain-containing protein [bacterium]
MDLRRREGAPGYAAVGKASGEELATFPSRRVAKGSMEIMRQWAANNLAGKTVEEMREMQERCWEQRWEAESEMQAAEVVSKMISEAIDQAVAQNPPVEMAKARTEVNLDIAKSLLESEHRYSFSPVYMPDSDPDAHGHFIAAETLQKSVWAWGAGDRSINDHHTEAVIGQLKELTCWPVEHTMPVTKSDGTTEPVTFPAGTAWAGIQWTPEAWPRVLAGDITGLSLAGRARLKPAS